MTASLRHFYDNQNLRVKPERNPHSASGLNHFSLGFPFEDFALVVIGLAAALKTLKLNRKPFLLSYTTCFSHVVCGVGKERVLPSERFDILFFFLLF